MRRWKPERLTGLCLDPGAEGGDEGGRVLATGTPEDVLERHTGLD